MKIRKRGKKRKDTFEVGYANKDGYIVDLRVISQVTAALVFPLLSAEEAWEGGPAHVEHGSECHR
jgi:hypothetical protein